MADNGLILVTGAAGQLGAVGRTVTGLLLDRGLPVRAMVRREDDRAAALRAAGAEVVLGFVGYENPLIDGSFRLSPPLAPAMTDGRQVASEVLCAG